MEKFCKFNLKLKTKIKRALKCFALLKFEFLPRNNSHMLSVNTLLIFINCILLKCFLQLLYKGLKQKLEGLPQSHTIRGLIYAEINFREINSHR